MPIYHALISLILFIWVWMLKSVMDTEMVKLQHVELWKMQWESIISMGCRYGSLDCGTMLLRSVLRVVFFQSVKNKLRIETSGKMQESQRSWNTCGESAGSWLTGSWRNQETKKKTWNDRSRESRELIQGPLGLNLQKYETAKISWIENFKWHLCSLDMCIWHLHLWKWNLFSEDVGIS